MTQIVIPPINVPTVTPNALTNALGVIGAIGVLLQPYLKTGSVSLETVAISIFVVVVCYFIGKKDPAAEAQFVSTIEGIVDSTLGTKLPALLTQAQPVNALETALVDAAATQAAGTAQQPGA